MVVCLIGLLEELADQREDEEREDRTPDEGVDDHQRPPQDAAGGNPERAGDSVAGLAEEALENQEADEVDDAQRNVGEQERFHFDYPPCWCYVYYTIINRRPSAASMVEHFALKA